MSTRQPIRAPSVFTMASPFSVYWSLCATSPLRLGVRRWQGEQSTEIVEERQAEIQKKLRWRFFVLAFFFVLVCFALALARSASVLKSLPVISSLEALGTFLTCFVSVLVLC